MKTEPLIPTANGKYFMVQGAEREENKAMMRGDRMWPYSVHLPVKRSPTDETGWPECGTMNLHEALDNKVVIRIFKRGQLESTRYYESVDGALDDGWRVD